MNGRANCRTDKKRKHLRNLTNLRASFLWFKKCRRERAWLYHTLMAFPCLVSKWGKLLLQSLVHVQTRSKLSYHRHAVEDHSTDPVPHTQLLLLTKWRALFNYFQVNFINSICLVPSCQEHVHPCKRQHVFFTFISIDFDIHAAQCRIKKAHTIQKLNTDNYEKIIVKILYLEEAS